ncbi:hypothetical protein, variant [Aphanomyces invadans]|uniref:Uncharacterized protein n=1 Tax=Aphanomyces invadans TaxID=157072 RepID=A0A024U7Y0_9STRA|nr:hypothetical protein, variant [Aphanomyces invadans]ETW01987.1 hypothetical protein, variant [Aphanomyces invadans]|eukprot:XP_008869835.1 hypothetical protein, variant [Aphanomyces invadans]
MGRKKRQWAFQEANDGNSVVADLRKTSAREMKYDNMQQSSAMHMDQSSMLRKKLHRDRIREYRRAMVLEAEFLTEKVNTLEAKLATFLSQQQERDKPLRSGRRLPWHEVANALKEAADDSITLHEDLTRFVEDNRVLIVAMTVWRNHHSAIQAFPRANTTTWRNTHLVLPEPSRQHGFEWITNHMLHQTASILDQCAFPPNDPSFLDVRFHAPDPNDGVGYIASHRHQLILHGSMPDVVEGLAKLYLRDKHTVPFIEKEDLDTQGTAGIAGIGQTRPTRFTFCGGCTPSDGERRSLDATLLATTNTPSQGTLATR